MREARQPPAVIVPVDAAGHGPRELIQLVREIDQAAIVALDMECLKAVVSSALGEPMLVQRLTALGWAVEPASVAGLDATACHSPTTECPVP